MGRTSIIVIFALAVGFIIAWKLKPVPLDNLNTIVAKEMVIKHRDVEIGILKDSIKHKDSLISISSKLVQKSELKVKEIRAKYEMVKRWPKTLNIDTLYTTIGLCDSIVLNQDTLINRLEYEGILYRQKFALVNNVVDSLQLQVSSLQDVNKAVRESNAIDKRKERRKKFWRTARDLGLGILGGMLIEKGL
jgi:hypothetical protein